MVSDVLDGWRGANTMASLSGNGRSEHFTGASLNSYILLLCFVPLLWSYFYLKYLINVNEIKQEIRSANLNELNTFLVAHSNKCVMNHES